MTTLDFNKILFLHWTEARILTIWDSDMIRSLHTRHLQTSCTSLHTWPKRCSTLWPWAPEWRRDRGWSGQAASGCRFWWRWRRRWLQLWNAYCYGSAEGKTLCLHFPCLASTYPEQRLRSCRSQMRSSSWATSRCGRPRLCGGGGGSAGGEHRRREYKRGKPIRLARS